MADRPRVLLVDPDEHSRQALELALQHITEMVSVASTEEVQQQLSSGPFDVVMADIAVPQQGGLWVLQQAQQQLPNAKRVLLSADRPENFPQLVQSGVATDLVRKPALVEHLVNVVVGTQPAPAPPAQS